MIELKCYYYYMTLKSLWETVARKGKKSFGPYTDIDAFVIGLLFSCFVSFTSPQDWIISSSPSAKDATTSERRQGFDCNMAHTKELSGRA